MVRGVDLKHTEFTESAADDFVIGDLRDPNLVASVIDDNMDELYQFALTWVVQDIFLLEIMTQM